MEPPRIIVNAKAYRHPKGVAALAEAAQRVGAAHDVVFGWAPPQTDLTFLARRADLPNVQFFAQHTDPGTPGSGTGKVMPHMVADAGAKGSILNHAERKIDHTLVAEALTQLHDVDLWSLVCADGDDEVRALAPLAPTMLAVEPPELIGGSTSVTDADPEVVRRAVKAVHRLSPKTKTLCGAGVKTGNDVAAALRLGAYGVLLASGVAAADDPRAALEDLVTGL